MVDGQRQDDARLVSDACDDVGTRDVGPMRSSHSKSSPVIRTCQASDITHSDKGIEEPPFDHET